MHTNPQNEHGGLIDSAGKREIPGNGNHKSYISEANPDNGKNELGSITSIPPFYKSQAVTLVELVAGSATAHAEPDGDCGVVRLFPNGDELLRVGAFGLADYVVSSVCGPWLCMVPRADQPANVSGCRMRHRAPDGYPIGADVVMREGYGKIPQAVGGKFQHNYGHELPVAVHGWAWSDTFNRWGALVTFRDGWRGFTWAATWSADADPANQSPAGGQI